MALEKLLVTLNFFYRRHGLESLVGISDVTEFEN